MKIIAKSENGYLLEATESDLVAIMSAVNKKPDKIEIGEKIPALDYAASLTKVANFVKSYEFRNFCTLLENTQETTQGLYDASFDLLKKIESS